MGKMDATLHQLEQFIAWASKRAAERGDSFPYSQVLYWAQQYAHRLDGLDPWSS